MQDTDEVLELSWGSVTQSTHAWSCMCACSHSHMHACSQAAHACTPVFCPCFLYAASKAMAWARAEVGSLALGWATSLSSVLSWALGALTSLHPWPGRIRPLQASRWGWYRLADPPLSLSLFQF